MDMCAGLMYIEKWWHINQLSLQGMDLYERAAPIVVDKLAVIYWCQIVFCFFMTQSIEGGGTAGSGGGPDCLGPPEERGGAQ